MDAVAWCVSSRGPGYVKHLEEDVVESAFYRGILAIHNEDFEVRRI